MAGDEYTTATSSSRAGVVDTNDASSPLSIEQQIKALRKELKTKEEKLARVTEHSMMMAAHMDKLKGEVRVVVFYSCRLRERYYTECFISSKVA